MPDVDIVEEKPADTYAIPTNINITPVNIDLIVKQELDRWLTKQDYDPQKALDLSKEIADKILNRLNTTLSDSTTYHRYKYVVNCSIQKVGSGLQSSTSCLWDSSTDFATHVKFENKNLMCTVFVYVISFD